MKPFQDKRNVLWLGGVIVLVLGILAAFVLLPSSQVPSRSVTDDIRVPKMENVPSDEAHKMKLELDKQE